MRIGTERARVSAPHSPILLLPTMHRHPVLLQALAFALVLTPAAAERAAGQQDTRSPVPISARDRVYTADQVSNTVSVIDPSSNRLLGQIRLGNRRPDLLSPLYKGQINVHGLGVSPDGRTLAVISTGSNGVTLIETATNRVKGTVYVGRNPHEGFFTPDGRELWVTVRGEDYVAVIDPVAMRVTRKIVTAPGPGMIVFRPDGKVAFVDHSFTPELDVVDVHQHQVIRRIPVVSPFSPNLAMTADGRQVWLTHKDVGKVTVVNAQTFAIEGVIETGPVTNHVNFAGLGGGTRVGGAAAGDYAYVTVGGENAVKVYTRERRLVTTIPVGAVPHGIWPSGDGSRIYVGLQQGDAVAVIDTRTNRKTAEIPIGQSPQALVYVVDAVPSGAGTSNLMPLAVAAPQNIRLSTTSGHAGRGTVTIRSLGPVDGVDLSANELTRDSEYTLFLSASGAMWPLATVRTDSTGRANVEAVAPTTIPRGGAGSTGAERRLMLVGGSMPTGQVVLEGTLQD
jgi:YVTN family beta-propeller protein